MNGLDCAPCPPLRGDDMIQIAVNRIGHRWISTCSFGGARQSRAHAHSYATEEAMLRGFVKTFLSWIQTS
jgi:hypothetical protein